MTLVDLPAQTTAPVRFVEGPRAFRVRLMEMGLLPGTPLRVLRHNRGGDLVEFEVRGTTMSLRSSEARHVHFGNGAAS